MWLFDWSVRTSEAERGQGMQGRSGGFPTFLSCSHRPCTSSTRSHRALPFPKPSCPRTVVGWAPLPQQSPRRGRIVSAQPPIQQYLFPALSSSTGPPRNLPHQPRVVVFDVVESGFQPPRDPTELPPLDGLRHRGPVRGVEAPVIFLVFNTFLGERW